MSINVTSLTKLGNNPIRGLNYVVNALETSWFEQKVNINSSTHPAIFCADLTIGTTFGFLNSLSDAISEVFPAHARNIAELSRNMNTIDHYGLFGNPATGKVNLIISLDNLKAFAPTATSLINGITLSYQKLLIPKDTQFDVAGYVFSIENGIEIRYNERTGVQVVYDSTTNNPFNSIATNVLTRRIQSVQGKDYLFIDVPIRQLACDAIENIPSTIAAGCKGSRTYSDYLYGVRAFITNASGVKTEMEVTYNKSVFDNGTLTMTIDLDTSSNKFNYSIPDIYIENGLGIGTVSVYTYTTKGTIDKDFRDTDLKDYVPAYRDYRYNGNTLGPYSDFFPNMGGVIWRFISPVTGGTVPNSFGNIKYRVVNGRRLRTLPITVNNIIGAMEESGYSAVKSIDFVTSRLFSVTKELPLQANKGFFSGMNCFVGTNLISAKKLVDSGIALDNGSRVTIPNNTTFNVTDQTVNLLTKTQVSVINSLTNAALIAYMETNSLAYTPFHHVFDATQNQAALRTYYLDNPSAGVQSFQEENTELAIEVGLDAVNVTYENNGYTILAQTISGTSYKVLTDNQVACQLSVTIPGSNQLASLKGELVRMSTDGERVYQFRLESNLDIDEADKLHVTNFNQYGSVQTDTPLDLTFNASFIFLRTVGNWNTVLLADSEIDKSLYPTPHQAVIKTNVEITLGRRLNALYNRIRPLIGEGQYQQYAFNVPETYPKDVYKEENGQWVFGDDNLPIVLHKAGSPMLTSDGNPIYAHLAGDWIKDELGNFIPLVGRELTYHWDFIGFDGVYLYSKDTYDISFAQTIKDYLADTIGQDIELFGQMIIDKTRILFQPKNKLGWKEVVVNSNYYSTLKQDLSFEVTYYLTKAGYNNSNLKASLKANSPKVLNNFLFGNITVATSKLVTALMANLPADVVDVKINALSGDTTVDVISSVDELSGFSLRKRLVLGDNKLPSIEEDVKTDFLIHDPSKMG